MQKNLILVTGGAGFIGSNLVRKLVSEGYEVIVQDNFSSGDKRNLEGIPHTLMPIAVEQGRIPDVYRERLCAIYHLGIPSSSPMYKDNPFLVADAVSGYMEILELAKETGAPLLYASSSSLYNGLDSQLETEQPLVKDYYTEARYYLERLCALYADFHGVKSVGFRFFSIYGPHEDAKGEFANIITQFMWGMRKGETPVIYGDGTQTRDFIFVEDLVDILYQALQRIGEMPPVVNIGAGRETTFNEVVEILNVELGTTIEPTYVENPIKNYVQKTKADEASISFTLFDKEFIDVREGIRRLLEY